MDRKLFAGIILFFLVSCKSIHVIKYASRKGNNLVKVTNLSLFNNEIKFSNSSVKNQKHRTIYLFFESDSLVNISSEKRVSKNDPGLFKFQRLNDSVNIISHESHRRYYETDTILFAGNYCIRKSSVYDLNVQPEKRSLANLTFTVYHFDNGNLVYLTKTITKEDFEKPESIMSLLYAKKSNATYLKQYAIEQYEDLDSAKFNFLTSTLF